jgi:hypothetical protein
MLLAEYSLEQLGFQRDFGIGPAEHDLGRLGNALVASVSHAGS